MSSLFDSFRKQLGYVASLPERTIRSLAAVAGGTTTLLTETLFPEVLRDTTMYRIFLGDTQKFLVEKVAQVQKEQAEGEDEASDDPNYVQKKMIGGALETAGLFAMHFSPLWVFAIAGDAAGGSRVFLDRLVDQLKRNGVVDDDADIDGLDALLGAMQDTSRRTAGAIDTPPLSRDEIKQLADDMGRNYSQMFGKAVDLVPRLDKLWGQMEQVAQRENVSLERLGGILTVDVASWGKKGIGAVLAVGQTGTDLFGERILDSYGRTLETISDEGVTGYLSNHMQPFVDAAAGHFSVDRKTWTESIAGKITDKIFGGTEDEAKAGSPEPEEGSDGPADDSADDAST